MDRTACNSVTMSLGRCLLTEFIFSGCDKGLSLKERIEGKTERSEKIKKERQNKGKKKGREEKE